MPHYMSDKTQSLLAPGSSARWSRIKVDPNSGRCPEKMNRDTKEVFSNNPGALENSPATYGDRILETRSQKR